MWMPQPIELFMLGYCGLLVIIRHIAEVEQNDKPAPPMGVIEGCFVLVLFSAAVCLTSLFPGA